MSNSVKVKKKNRVLHVEADRLVGFLNQGYDQVDEEGNVVKRATGGRTVSLAEHNKVLSENDDLKKENTALKGQITKLENTKDTKK